MGKDVGKTNQYILNLMIHGDTCFMNEYVLKDRINKRFNYKLRANEVKKNHIDPLINRHWLIELKKANNEICYVRLGGFKRVSRRETLRDQFSDIPQYLLASFIDYVDSEAWENLDLFDSLSEKDYSEYWQHEYETYLTHLKREKLTPDEEKDLERMF